METKYHYFNFCFVENTPNGVAYNSIQNNFGNQNITIEKIKNTKIAANVKLNAVLISCSYLGYMTYNEFMGK